MAAYFAGNPMATSSQPARILIVDDDDSVRVVLRQALVRAGYEVIEAADGNEAVRLFKEAPAKLVITDILMPDKDGIETIQEFRRTNPGVKIIAISGGGRIDPKMCLLMAKMVGANRVLPKPFQAQTLLAAVRELLPE
jgi:DNA-binding response OmpR family regulator